MTNKQLERVLKDINLFDCEPLIEDYIFYIKKMIKSRVNTSNGKYRYSIDEYEFLVITNGYEKQAIILRCGTADLHWLVLRKWRGQGVLSNALRTGILQRVWPENKAVTCCYSWSDKMLDRSKKYQTTKYLAEIAGLKLID